MYVSLDGLCVFEGSQTKNEQRILFSPRTLSKEHYFTTSFLSIINIIIIMASSSFPSPSKQSVITGEMIIPKRCFQPGPKITISLQDNSRIDRKGVEIASRSLYPAYITAGDKIPFSLPYEANDLLADTNEWYTLHIRITTLVEHQDDAGLSMEDEILVCFNHRVTRAIDDDGAPVKCLQISLINARPQILPATRQAPLSKFGWATATGAVVAAAKRSSFYRAVLRKSKIEAE
jgi:hypothetical protein